MSVGEGLVVSVVLVVQVSLETQNHLGHTKEFVSSDSNLEFIGEISFFHFGICKLD